jgi:PHD/YefM family antitoxin component YafN of YafNO toxin-antitoxin module
MADQLFKTLHVSEAQQTLPHLHQRVARENGRVLIVDTDGTLNCVLLSKAELDSLERALEILSDGEHFKIACHALSRLGGSDPMSASAQI